uniref:Uncharacterized protein n=1 Tax=Brassica campestris TaxID=3711 RepID=A0A3P5Z590_BRACM|nr:unnamed protein product [Brassica rapa]
MEQPRSLQRFFWINYSLGHRNKRMRTRCILLTRALAGLSLTFKLR